MPRKTIYATLIVILIMGAAFAQTGPAPESTPSMPGYSPMRSEEERQKDRTIDRSYETTIKRAGPDAVKNSDPWGDVRATPPAPAAKKKQQRTHLRRRDSGGNLHDDFQLAVGQRERHARI